MKKIAIGGVAGGFALFVWSSVYWAASGIPIGPMKTFTNEAAVEAVLRENAPEPGYYVLPTPHMETEAGAKAAEMATKRMEKVATGFFFAGAVQPGGLGPLGTELLLSLLGNIVSAAMMTFLLTCVTNKSYGCRVLFCLTGGLFAGVVCQFPMLVWWGHPAPYIARHFFDLAVGWTLAGLVLARVTRDA